jgi:hypothetical protein
VFIILVPDLGEFAYGIGVDTFSKFGVLQLQVMVQVCQVPVLQMPASSTKTTYTQTETEIKHMSEFKIQIGYFGYSRQCKVGE